MPPHDPEIRIPLTINTDYTTGPLDGYVTATPWTTDRLDGVDADTYSNTIHTTTNNTYDNWVTMNSPYRDWISNSLNINADASHIDAEVLGKKVRIAIDKVLDQYFRKLYEIINDVHNFSISEDEFMKLLKED